MRLNIITKTRDELLIKRFNDAKYKEGDIVTTVMVYTKHVKIKKINKNTIKVVMVNKDGTSPKIDGYNNREFLLEKKYVG